MDGMTIPFVMLLIITIALVLERKFQEDKINEIYEEKFNNWKKHTKLSKDVISHKELVGLVYLQDYKLSIDILSEKAIDPLERKSYTINKKDIMRSI
jgi:hypothetical protein